MNIFEFNGRMNGLGHRIMNYSYDESLPHAKSLLNLEEMNMNRIESVRQVTTALNLCTKSNSIIDKIARDAAKIAVEMAEEDLFREAIFGKKWHKIESEKDLPSPEMYEYVLVRGNNIDKPWVISVKNLVKKPNGTAFMDATKDLYVHYWCEIPEFDID